ncbi:MAG: hypothetical protein ACXVAI_07125, partial [Candidatus Limnocylindrales bacterium]
MSVGLQRLRDDALRLRQGALDKGEDPEAVDRAVALDVQRRELAAEADGLRAARRKLSEEIAAAVRGGGRSRRPAVRRPEGSICRAGAAYRRARRGPGRRRGRAGRPASAHPQPGRSGRARGGRGSERDRPDLGRAGRPCPARRFDRAPPLGGRG